MFDVAVNYPWMSDGACYFISLMRRTGQEEKRSHGRGREKEFVPEPSSTKLCPVAFCLRDTVLCRSEPYEGRIPNEI